MALQALEYASDVLKNDYLPIWKNQINLEPSPFLEKIRKEALVSKKIYATSSLGLNGGFGFGTELSTVPTPGGQRYESFEISPVAMYSNIEISDMAIKLGTTKGATVNLLHEEITGSYAAAKWNIARALFGDGSGKLGTFSSLINNSASITLNSVDNVIIGLYIDIYNNNSGTITKITDSGPKRIINVDPSTKTITIDSAVTTTHGGFITVQGSYNNELTGLKAIFDSSVTSLYGITKSQNTWIYPQSVDAEYEMSDLVLYRAVALSKRMTGSDIDMIMMADDTFLAYQNYMRESNVVIVENSTYVGGAAGYKIVVGNRKIDVVNEPHVPSGKAWCVDTNKFKFETTDLAFADEQGSNVFIRMENYPRYRALLVQYGNIICSNPGGCVEIINCVEP